MSWRSAISGYDNPRKMHGPSSWVIFRQGGVLFLNRLTPIPGLEKRSRRFRASEKTRPGIALIVAGTRPECIKLATVIRELGRGGRLQPVVVNSGQHAATVRQTLTGFGIHCDVELAPLPPLASLAAACRNLEARLRELIDRIQPAVVVVQGDTLTAYAAARAGHRAGFPVAHIEAGLRTDNAADPFPEELFRRHIARHANLHFAPCRSAEQNLRIEGIDPATIHRVGNTGIDSLRALLEQHDCRPQGASARRDVLVTLHRRENLDGNADILCDALIELISRKPELNVVFPVHPNPRSALRIRRRLGGHLAFQLVEPMRYPDFINVAANAALLVSDSGGLQEEAPHLGVPLLVPRSNTERPEGLATGFVRLVAAEAPVIVRVALEMLAAPRARPLAFDEDAPFGAGDSATRIVAVLEAMEFEPSKAGPATRAPTPCAPPLAEVGAR